MAVSTFTVNADAIRQDEVKMTVTIDVKLDKKELGIPEGIAYICIDTYTCFVSEYYWRANNTDWRLGNYV